MPNQPFFSYEGEGHLLGHKTLFCDYPGGGQVEADPMQVAAVFINAASVNLGLMTLVASVQRVPFVTVEVSLGAWLGAPDMVHRLVLESNVQLFVVCETYAHDLPDFRGYIKIRVYNEVEGESKVRLANRYLVQGREVLLMPEFENPGEWMAKAFRVVRPGVRVMPPVQQLLGIR